MSDVSEPIYHETTPAGVQVIRWPHAHPLPEAEVAAFFTARGVRPTRWANEPGAVYEPHAHAYRKTLFCLGGGITFALPDGSVTLRAGDRLIIPSGVRHSATVGPAGVICLEGTDA